MKTRGITPIRLAAIFVLLAGLVAICFRAVVFQDRQFAFRDAAHHYYPLHQRVQQEWQAGRIPLWDPWQNGGMPLAGNPTAAVFYPGKLVFFVMPFAWASRVYVIMHVPFAFFGTWGLLRAWGLGRAARILGALAYAFGGPVLHLNSNVIYLVGAAWLPWSLWALQRCLKKTNWRAIGGLAACLALCVLGGDPQTAYLVVVSGIFQCWWSGAAKSIPALRLRSLGLIALGWLCLSVVMVWLLPGYRTFWSQWSWEPACERLLRYGTFAGLAIILIWQVGDERSEVARKLSRVVLGSSLGLLLASIQVLPTAGFVAESARGGAGAGLDRYGFSLVPYRLVELVWPGILGSPYPINASWRSTLPPVGDPTFWVPSLYMGAPTLVLALMGALRGRARLRRGMLILIVISLLASFGLYAAPFGWSRWLPLLEGRLPLPAIEHVSGAHDDFRAGDGGPYWLLASIIPGFDLFRYPSKLFTWTALGIATLAALGFDALKRSRGRWTLAIALGFVQASLVASVLLMLWIRLGHLNVSPGRASSTTGPFHAGRAVVDSLVGVLHGLAIFGAFAAMVALRGRIGRWWGAAVIALLAIDLAVAQPRWVWSIPQEFFETPPEALRAIEAAEAADPAGGPYRIHRPTVWHPFGWFADSSPQRLEQIVSFERDSLQALYGLPYDQGYAFTLGILEPEAHLRLFRPWIRPIGPKVGPSLGLAPDAPVLYFPRRAFDLWNTRYFIMPVDPLNWRDENRAYAAFLENADVIAPDVTRLQKQGLMASWRREHDWQVLRNKSAFPRAWVVHEATVLGPMDSLDERQRDTRLRTFLYEGDAIWREPDRGAVDLRRVAWVESVDARGMRLGLQKPVDAAAESVRVRQIDPQRVVIDAKLTSRGLVVLADAYADGWRLLVDGAPALIVKTNLGMRGAVVDAGAHELEYRYEPANLFWGAVLSVSGVVMTIGLAALGARGTRGRRGPHRS